MEAWNNSQVFYVHNLAKAYANLLAANQLKVRLETYDFKGSDDNRKSLELLFRICVLSYVLDDSGTFLLHGYFDAEQFEMLQEL